jgi:BirA family biotin operon repressor/biotin-[acetyl-CoA-carboxylase] ligase
VRGISASGLPGALDRWEGRPIQEWERRWGVPRFEAYDELPSTNDRLRVLAEAGAAHFTVVTADSQTAGKGRGGKRWESPGKMGLWISFLVRSASEVSPTLMPILVGLAASRALERLCPSLRPGIKWPNDIEVKGRKLGGILCEGAGTGAVVVGVGLNLRQGIEDFSPGLKERAASMEMAGCRGVSRSRVAGELLLATRSLVDPVPTLLDESLRREVRDRDILTGRTVCTDLGTTGRAIGIGADGALLVEVEDRVEEIRAGSVMAVEAGRSTGPESK